MIEMKSMFLYSAEIRTKKDIPRKTTFVYPCAWVSIVMSPKIAGEWHFFGENGFLAFSPLGKKVPTLSSGPYGSRNEHDSSNIVQEPLSEFP